MNVKLLRAVQEEKGIMSKFVAEKIGLHRAVYCKRLHGGAPFKLDEVPKIAKALNLTLKQVNDIFFDGELPTR